ncbi:hypothetical protein [Yoonia sp.]|uniref:hypothetical protein n=1 Tax=Yoonia sp. TaxID=2212373 RepID=UPI0019FDC89A|nr:hypothetical protein [Yoonia sp.]MBE0413836.1 hypothetical protein [Yoonia sp.]
MRKQLAIKLCSVAPLALAAALGTPVWADLLPDDVVISTSGDGIIFVDTTEGVVAPRHEGGYFHLDTVTGGQPTRLG